MSRHHSPNISRPHFRTWDQVAPPTTRTLIRDALDLGFSTVESITSFLNGAGESMSQEQVEGLLRSMQTKNEARQTSAGWTK